MNERLYNVVTIGNAIMDMLVTTTDEFLIKHNMPKGRMTLIDEVTVNKIYQHIKDKCVMCPGGSAANTAVGIAALGGRSAFIGKVSTDDVGLAFSKGLNDSDVIFVSNGPRLDKPTARCMIFVTPDAQRTMNTFLGSCSKISRLDIDEEIIKKAYIIYIEGYLLDGPKTKDALLYAIELSKKHKTLVSLSLSDSRCVERHRDMFFEVINSGVDILFGNEYEYNKLFNTKDLNESVSLSKDLCKTVVITCGEKGAIAIEDNEQHSIQAVPFDHIVDTTGAGDMFAAGFLYAYSKLKSIDDCLQVGTLASAENISHYGAKPQNDLRNLIKD